MLLISQRVDLTSRKANRIGQPFARVEMTNDPGATTSGLKRPKSSSPTPTLPRLENDATSLSLSVAAKNWSKHW
jgi:hypothetical protein